MSFWQQPPPSVGIAATLISRGLKKPLVYDLRDLWPEALVNSGRLQNPWSYACLRKPMTSPIEQQERSRPFQRERRGTHCGWSSSRKSSRHSKTGCVCARLTSTANEKSGRFDNFLLNKAFRRTSSSLPIGIMNPPQGLSILLDCAEALSVSEPSVHFVLIGEGSNGPAWKREPPTCRMSTFWENSRGSASPPF